MRHRISQSPLLLGLLAIALHASASERGPREVILEPKGFESQARLLETPAEPRSRPSVIIRGSISLARSMTWYVRDVRFDPYGQVFLRGFSLTIDVAEDLTATGSNVDPQIGGFPSNERATDGRNGADGGPGGYPSGPGQAGTAAENGQNGQDAGSLTLRFTRQPKLITLRISLAGQAGGNGGNGGSGGKGAPGAKGETAASGPFGCNHGGGNGGNGGRGGDGGTPGCGGAGGTGGTVYLSIQRDNAQQRRENDTGLFARILPNCVPGPGGKAGKNGVPGNQGLGGDPGAGGDGSGFCNGGRPGQPGEQGRPANQTACTPPDGATGRLLSGEAP